MKCSICNKEYIGLTCGNIICYNIINNISNNKKQVKCDICNLYISEKQITKHKKSKACRNNVKCLNCNNEIKVSVDTKGRHSFKKFCNQSCAATYNNQHKTTGTRRSKLEKWLENQLTNLYPNLQILFNNKQAINSELDIYFPSLKLAFELNGIYHYEPIHGIDKLNKTQNNDKRKFQACLEQNIEFVIIDTSHQKYFKEISSLKYLTIITNIINQKLVTN